MHANRKYDVVAEFLEPREISELLTKRTQINFQRVGSCLSYIFEKKTETFASQLMLHYDKVKNSTFCFCLFLH